MEPSTSSACRSISAAIAAAPTWGRRRFASPALGEQLADARADGHRQGRRAVADSRSARAPAIRRSATSRRSPRSASALYQASLASFAEGAMPIALGGDHSLGAGSVAAAADARAQARQAARADLGRCARRHEQSRRPASRATCTACRWRRCSARGPAELAHFAGDTPAVLAKHTVLVGIRNLDEREKEIVRAVEGARLHDEGDRSPGHRRGDGARDRDRDAAPAAFTSRTISMSAIPPSRPASARRSRAASAIAKRTS